MDEADLTERVLVIVHITVPEHDQTPTSPIVLEDNTMRLRCEFEEETVEQYLWNAIG